MELDDTVRVPDLLLRTISYQHTAAQLPAKDPFLSLTLLTKSNPHRATVSIVVAISCTYEVPHRLGIGILDLYQVIQVGMRVGN